MADLIGQNLGQYRIIEQLGQGGMATVYKGYQPSLDRYVAIKVLPPYFAHEPGFAERFTREARAVARLNHPNILPIYDFGQEGELSYIVSKYVEAGTLADRIVGPMPFDLTADVVCQIAAALDHAHRRGILHRDVKPSNVLLDEGRWVLLTDFGLAKMVEGSVALTGSGVGVGTPSYMAPEQGRGETVDERADVYSLGIVLYEMLTGRVPFQAETPMAVVIKHITDPLPLPRSVNPQISEAAERVVLKALAKDPRGRFATATELSDALASAIAASGAPAPEVADVLPLRVPPPAGPPPEDADALAPAAGQPAAPAESTPQASAERARKRRPPWAIIGGVAGVLVIVALAILIASGLGRPAPTAVIAATSTATRTAVPATPAPTHTATHTAAATATQPPQPATPTRAPTSTPTRRPTSTPTSRPTRTPVPTATRTRAPTATPTPTALPTATPTTAPTPTPQLPGVETIPIDRMAPRIPWLPLDESARPFTYLYTFNVTKSPFDDRRVRQAFALALDRRAIARVTEIGSVRPATTLVPSMVLGRDLYGAVGLPVNPDRARRLLAEAGYPNGTGLPPITLTYHHSPMHEAVARAAVLMWRDHLGIDVTLEPVGDWNAYIERIAGDAPPLFRVGWQGETNDPHDYFVQFTTEGATIGHGLSNPELDRLVQQAADTGDPATRQVLYIRAERVLCEQEAATIPLFHAISGQ